MDTPADVNHNDDDPQETTLFVANGKIHFIHFGGGGGGTGSSTNCLLQE